MNAFKPIYDSELFSNTSYHNFSLYASLNELKKMFGNPMYTDSPDGKVQFEWHLRTSNGDLFTIYDWKEFLDIGENPDEYIEWHIGTNAGGGASKRVYDFINSHR